MRRYCCRVASWKAVESRLGDAERCLDESPETAGGPSGTPGGPVFADEEQFRGLPGMIAVYRAGLAQVRGSLSETMHYARLALELIPEADHLGRGAASALLGLALWASGDLEAAHRTFDAGMARVRVAGHVPDVIASTIALADMRIA